MTELTAYLNARPYPGRGIVLGLGPEGTRAYIAYFIMGRSENSRNRVFTPHDGGIITEAADPQKLSDPSLIIYAPVRKMADSTVVTNGVQTDTIKAYLDEGKSFEDALRTHTFEPDPPNFTPRISGLLHLGLDGFSYRLSIVKSEGEGRAVRRFFYEYPQPLPGEGHIIHTYAGGGEAVPSFEGEPVRVAMAEGLDAFGEAVWGSLNGDNRVSLFVRSIRLDGGEETRIYNRYEKV